MVEILPQLSFRSDVTLPDRGKPRNYSLGLHRLFRPSCITADYSFPPPRPPMSSRGLEISVSITRGRGCGIIYIHTCDQELIKSINSLRLLLQVLAPGSGISGYDGPPGSLTTTRRTWELFLQVRTPRPVFETRYIIITALEQRLTTYLYLIPIIINKIPNTYSLEQSRAGPSHSMTRTREDRLQ